MNTICKVDGNRIANDVNYFLIEMWKKLINGWVPKKVNKNEYNKVRSNQNKYPAYFVGWVGFNCSYSGKWFGDWSNPCSIYQFLHKQYKFPHPYQLSRKAA